MVPGMDRLGPGIIAVIVGAVLAVALFVPFVAASYRVRGRVTLSRTLLWIALLMAFLALWAYTILPAPLPTDEYRCTTPNLDIFMDLRDIIRLQQSGGSILANAALQVTLLNVLFFMPIGFLARVMFGWGVVRATLAGFVLSLAVETTQLTGLWGIYPCSYRLFSVGDLLHNTAGAVLGSLIALLIVRRRTRVASLATDVPVARLTIGRRLLAAFCDVLLYFVVGLVVGLVVSVLAAAAGWGQADGWEGTLGVIAAVLVYGVPLLVTGATLGEHAVLIEVRGGWQPVVLARVVRGLGGFGGILVTLQLVPAPVGGWLTLGWALALVASIFAVRPQRSLGAALAGMQVGVRMPRAVAPGEGGAGSVPGAALSPQHPDAAP